MGAARANRHHHAKARNHARTESAGDLYVYAYFAFFAGFILLAVSFLSDPGLAPSARQLNEELSALPEASVAPPGTRSVLTGTIAAGTEPLEGDFVVYVTEIYRGASKYNATTWEHEKGAKQIFSIDAPDGSLRLARADYTLSPRVSGSNAQILPDWDHTSARTEEPPQTWQGAKRTRGLIAGGPVTAIGTVTPRGEFDAEFVIGATREELMARLAPIASGEEGVFYRLSAFLGLAALALCLALVVAARRRGTQAGLAN